MKPDASRLLLSLRDFLLEKVADAVPAELRSEIRAASKNIENAIDELEQAFPLLSREYDELIEILERTRGGLGQVPRKGNVLSPAQDLTELRQRHTKLLDAIGEKAVALQDTHSAEAQAALAEIYTLLRRQAHRRLAWQSVFPSDRIISTTLCSSWPKEKC